MQTNVFADLPPTPAEHFKLYFYAAVLHVIVQASQSLGSRETAFEHFPFLEGYYDELATQGLEGLAEGKLEVWWRDTLRAWEDNVPGHLPLRALREVTGLSHTAVSLLLSIGLIEEDARFGPLFEAIQGMPGQHRPTLGLLNAWWRESADSDEIRIILRRLQELGLIQVVNPDAPRVEWALQLPGLLWDVLRGDVHEALAPWAHYSPPTQLATYDELILPETLRQQLAKMPQLLEADEVQALIVRGLQHNGRRTVLGAVARTLERGLLEIRGLSKTDDERWRVIGPLATLLHALPAIVLDLGPGETAELPSLNGYSGLLGIVLGKQGGLNGPGVECALTLTLDMPDIEARRLHWQHGFGTHPVNESDAICECCRMTSGYIRLTAVLAQSYSALAGHPEVTLADVQQASRALNRQALETLTVHIPTTGDWSHLAVGEETLRELVNLESRCRHRELLHTAVGPALSSQLNAGVRALLTGPSGTGKTLAARLLASILQKDLYRLDLSAVVNKYIGETEKSMNAIFARAEELDVILLLDEGDALLTRRTNVQTSNDRYANLETNYLLQRLESFEGILLVTTNAIDRIDGAFQRRMDVVVDFRPPDVAERWAIWQLHLPVEHAIDLALLREVAVRCILTGGQIRNAVLHASLLGLNDGGRVTSAHLERAVQREYRKMGAVCPLRRTSSTSLNRG
jgi:ATPase family associated with various cellular activities (AAA)